MLYGIAMGADNNWVLALESQYKESGDDYRWMKKGWGEWVMFPGCNQCLDFPSVSDMVGCQEGHLACKNSATYHQRFNCGTIWGKTEVNQLIQMHVKTELWCDYMLNKLNRADTNVVI